MQAVHSFVRHSSSHPSTLKAKALRSRVQGQPELLNETFCRKAGMKEEKEKEEEEKELGVVVYLAKEVQ